MSRFDTAWRSLEQGGAKDSGSALLVAVLVATAWKAPARSLGFQLGLRPALTLDVNLGKPARKGVFAVVTQT